MLALALVLLACKGGDDTVDTDHDTDTDTTSADSGDSDVGGASYDDLVGVFDSHCGSCHQDGNVHGDLRLDRDVAYDQLVGVPADGDPTWTRVVCGDHEHSALWVKTGPDPVPFGTHMPPDIRQLDDESHAIIASWIDAGCPKPKGTAGTKP